MTQENQNPLDSIVQQAEEYKSYLSESFSTDPQESKKEKELENRDLVYRDKEQDIELKRFFSSRIIWITYIWLGFVIVVFICSGISSLCGKQFLSDSVLIATIGSASLGVITGLTAIILRYLFPKR